MINKLPVSEIKLNPNNPRLIKDDKFKKLVQSIKDFPEMANIRPVVLNKDYIILGGNMRFRAMKAAGWKEIPVTIVDLPEDKQREFVIKDNVSGGEWDWELLANEWDTKQLDDWGLDLPKDMQEEPEIEEDEAPELSEEEPKSKLGEIYQLGNHRVMCGDSTDKASVKLLMAGVKADMVFTDPPYGVDYDGVNNDHLKAEKLREFITEALQIVFENCRDGSNAYVWHPDIHAYEFIGAFRDAGFTQAKPSIIQWVKDTLVLSQGDYHSRNEPCLYGWKSGKNRQRVEDRTQDTIWEYPKPKKADGHPTMKPIELCTRAIKNSSKKGEVVIDTFLGSGSTLIACEQTDRICYGMELDPKYVDVIRKRWAKFVYPDTWEERWEELTPVLSEK